MNVERITSAPRRVVARRRARCLCYTLFATHACVWFTFVYNAMLPYAVAIPQHAVIYATCGRRMNAQRVNGAQLQRTERAEREIVTTEEKGYDGASATRDMWRYLARGERVVRERQAYAERRYELICLR